jgi:hypothetical protein
MLEAELDMSCYLMAVRIVGYNGLGFSLASRFANYWEKNCRDCVTLSQKLPRIQKQNTNQRMQAYKFGVDRSIIQITFSLPYVYFVFQNKKLGSI